MIPTSENYNRIIIGNGRKFHAKAHVQFADGKTLDLDDRNIMSSGGVGIEDAVSESGKFQIGTAIIGELTLKLNNYEGAFNNYNFKDAVIFPWVGLTTAVHWRDGEIVEWIPKGVFNVNESPAVGSEISIVADDNLSKLDIKYSKSSLKYPATLGEIAQDACLTSGVTLTSITFPNSDYVVTKRPTDENITCREIISYVAELAGCFARCDKSGEISIRWYEESTPVYDVGKSSVSYTVATSDTVITGIQITGNNDAKTVFKSGTDEYAISIAKNPLAQGNLQGLTDALASRFVGLSFRSYSVSSSSNPAIEAGNIVNMTDKQGVVHKTLVSRLSYEIGENEQYNADAEPPIEKNSQRNSISSQTLQKAHEEAAKQISAYDVAVKQLSQLMINAMGFYQTVEKQPNGSEIDYMHDKPKLADSTTIWKRTVDGMAVSTDGGKTYTAGITKDGNAVVKVLTAIGINADWIIAGILKSRSAETFFDLDGNLLGVRSGNYRVCLQGGNSSLLVQYYENSSWKTLGSFWVGEYNGFPTSIVTADNFTVTGNNSAFAWSDGGKRCIAADKYWCAGREGITESVDILDKDGKIANHLEFVGGALVG